jgi:hypothetical protein
MEEMEEIEELTPAFKRAYEEGIDLSQLSERLSLSATERIQKNLQMLHLAAELRKAGQEQRGHAKS